MSLCQVTYSFIGSCNVHLACRFCAGEALSVFFDALFSETLLLSSSWENDSGKPFSHISLNVFSPNTCKPIDHALYGMSITWYKLPLQDSPVIRKEVSARGSSQDSPMPATSTVSTEDEYILVQVRKFNDFDEESFSHPFVTRLSLNVFVIEAEAVLKGDSRECQKLYSLASLLASLGPVDEPSKMRQDIIPLLIVALVPDNIDEARVTDFEVKVWSALKGLLPRVHIASSARTCFYVKVKDGTCAGDDNGISRVRSTVRMYARNWKPDVNWAEREIAMIKRGQRQKSTIASTYFDSQRHGDLSDSEIESRLRYFHDKGVVVYPPGLRSHAQHIVLNLHWLCTQINSILSSRPTSLPPRFLAGLASMRESGVTSQEVVSHLLDEESNDSLEKALMLILDHYGICLQAQSRVRPQPPYVDSATTPPSRISSSATSRANVVVPHFLPACLPKESRSNVKDIAPLAIRGKGRKIPYLFYSKLCHALLSRFPIGWQLSKSASRFSVEPGHVLRVIYNRSFIVLTMEVRCRGSAMSPKTSFVCDSARQFVEGILQSLKARYHMKGLIFDFGGLKGPADKDGFFDSADFISRMDPSLSLDDLWLLYDENGRDYEPSETFFLWFNLGGKRLQVSGCIRIVHILLTF